MRPSLLGIFIPLGLIALAGCQAQRIGGQGKDFRAALLDMYTDQIMDNLIRAKNNEPFVQLEYTELFVLEADEISGGGSWGEPAGNARTAVFSGASSNTLARTVGSTFSLSGKSDTDNRPRSASRVLSMKR